MTYSDELDWRLAARWAGYKFDDFQLLDGEEQSSIVAAYTLSSRIESVLTKYNIKRPASQPAPKKASRGKRGKRR